MIVAKRLQRISAIIATCIHIAACGQQANQTDSNSVEMRETDGTVIATTTDRYRVIRIHDSSSGVTCWVLETKSISCIPDSELKR